MAVVASPLRSATGFTPGNDIDAATEPLIARSMAIRPRSESFPEVLGLPKLYSPARNGHDLLDSPAPVSPKNLPGRNGLDSPTPVSPKNSPARCGHNRLDSPAPVSPKNSPSHVAAPAPFFVRALSATPIGARARCIALTQSPVHQNLASYPTNYYNGSPNAEFATVVPSSPKRTPLNELRIIKTPEHRDQGVEYAPSVQLEPVEQLLGIEPVVYSSDILCSSLYSLSERSSTQSEGMTCPLGGECSDNKRDQPVACGNGSQALKRSSFHRKVARDLTKEMTFRPVMNPKSLQIASRSRRQCVPLFNRLSEKKKKASQEISRGDCTFSPRINAHSIKLAQERASKIHEVRARNAEQAAKKNAEVNSNYTFKPRVSERSLRIAQSLGTSFEKRQKMHLEKKKKTVAKIAEAGTQKEPLKKRSRPAFLNRIETDDSSQSASSAGTPPTATPPFSKMQASAGHSHSAKNLATKSCTNMTHQKRMNVFPISTLVGPKTKNGSVRKRCQIDDSAGKRSRTKTDNKASFGSAKFSTLSESDRFKRAKMIAEQKIKEKKVFLIQGGYRLLRRCLRNRGWVEFDYYKNKNNNSSSGTARTSAQSTTKTTPPKRSTQAPKGRLKVVRNGGEEEEEEEEENNDDDDGDDDDDDDDSDVDLDLGLSDDEYSDEEEYCLVSRNVRNCTPNFVWTLYRDPSVFDTLHKSTVTNHFAKVSSFTTKDDLCGNLQNLLWYGDTDPDTFFPRCYRLGYDEEKEMFIDDYRFTAAVSMLKILSERHSQGLTPSIANLLQDTNNVEVNPETLERVVQLALKAGEAYLGSKYHDDIENSDLHLCPKILDSEWDIIVEYYHKVNANRKVACNPELVYQINNVLREIEEKFPQYGIDGHDNIWILKPGASSRGRGIRCATRMEDILAIAGGNSVVRRTNRWVVQKYIERPLLIHNTKFDIRQWFLVTDWNPLTMWMYKDCYLRFSSQPFTLDRLDVSVHLCNNSVQKHYENDPSRSESLPSKNMWDDQTFQNYLGSIGEGNCWKEVIYPGMKKALINVLQVIQDEVEQKKNCFELYGADFMISSDLRPWLIEINSSPTMEASTEVTARLCRQVLEDTVKVVIDRRENKSCDIGRFELAYKQARIDVPPYVGIQLCVKGSAIAKRKNQPGSSLCTATDHSTAPVPAVVGEKLVIDRSTAPAPAVVGEKLVTDRSTGPVPAVVGEKLVTDHSTGPAIMMDKLATKILNYNNTTSDNHTNTLKMIHKN